MSQWLQQMADLRSPLDGWDFDTVPIGWPGEEFAGPPFTADRKNPARCIVWRAFSDGSSYLASGNNRRHLVLRIIASILVEPIVGEEWPRSIADELEAAYDLADVDETVFRTAEAVLEPFGDDEGWNRWDWRCPVWRFEP